MKIKCFYIERVPDKFAQCSRERRTRDHECPIYRRTDTGEEKCICDWEVGAMWYFYGEHLMVRTPGGDWYVDGRASNCTMPNDDVHECWVRHGQPPDITVDKNGNTCQAGAGSILIGGYHGFLRGGYLEEC